MGRRENKDRRTSVPYTWGEEGIASGNWGGGKCPEYHNEIKRNGYIMVILTFDV